MPIAFAVVVIALVGILSNKKISREAYCLSLSIKATLEKNDGWPSLPLWARYYFHAYLARDNEDAVFLFDKAVQELRKYKGSAYWIARILYEKHPLERALGRVRQTELRVSLVKFLVARGPRDSRAARYWYTLGEFYETSRRNSVRAKTCYERSLVSAFISPSGCYLHGKKQIELSMLRLHALTGSRDPCELVDKDYGYLREVSGDDDRARLDDAENCEDYLEMPGWPLPHRLYSPVTKCWGVLHDSPTEIDGLYQSVLNKRAEELRNETPEGATIMNRYAGFLRRQGRIDEASKLDKKVIEIRDGQPKPVYLPANWKQLAYDTSVP